MLFSCVELSTPIRFMKRVESQYSGSVFRTISATPVSAGKRMLPSGSSWLSWKAGVAFAAILAASLLTPQIATAGCGDYLVIRGSHAPIGHSIPDQPTLERPAGTTDHNPPHQPCQGPSCRGGSLPPQAPAPGTTHSMDHWALTSSETLPHSVSCSNLLAESLQITSDGFCLSILRPPR